MALVSTQKAGQKEPKYFIDKYRRECFDMDTSIQDICDMLGIKKRTFHRDRRMLKGEKTDIPFGRMRKYAQLFKVQLLQLCNEDIDQPSYEDIKKARERAMDTSTGIVNDFNLS